MNKKIVWLPYDFDTSIGINNEGSLVFSYNLEDTDHLSGGADVYNGQESVVWNNIRQAFSKELASMYAQLRSDNKLSYELVEQMFEDHQSKWPESIFNEDAWFKYIDPLIEEGKGDYLPMLQGSKAEQRKWWLYNRFRYIDSKYNAGYALSDYIQLRAYAKANITITPYADVYPTIKFGSYLVKTRGARNTATTIVCPVSAMNDTEVYIFSASQLASVGDLSPLKVGFADFSMATKLQSIKLGDSDSNYSNANLKTLTLGNNVLLQTVDVRNCTALSVPVNLAGCSNIEHVYFDGTAVTGVTLPNGGILKTLHLPGTITNLTLQNQAAITDLTVADYSNISTLRIENCPTVDTKSILEDIPIRGTRIRLTDFYWECADYNEVASLLTPLMSFAEENGELVFVGAIGMDENGNNLDYCAQSISGRIHVTNSNHTGSLTGAQIAEMKALFPNITLTADHTTATLTYKTFDGASTIATETITDGGNGTRTNNTSRASSAQYTYSPDGWSTVANGSKDTNALKAVIADRTVYAAYTATTRTYTVRFYNGSTLLESDANIPYGGSTTYDGTTPTSSDGEFLGWYPLPTNIQPDGTSNYYNCYAQFLLQSYGVIWDYSDSDPALIRTDLAASFADPVPATSVSGSGSSPFDNILPWSGMKRYNVINGAVSYSEDDPEFSETDYDTVVYIPEFYYKVSEDATAQTISWKIASTALSGFTKHPGSGVYVGRFHTSGSSSAVYTKSGQTPYVTYRRSDIRSTSKNKGTGWRMLDFKTWSAIQILYLVEYANFDSQVVLGFGLADSASFSAPQTEGATTGANYHTVKASGTSNSYRWLENLYSNALTIVDGITIATNGNVYLRNNPPSYSDGTSTYYNTAFPLPGGYINRLQLPASSDYKYAFLGKTGRSGDEYAHEYLTDTQTNNSSNTRVAIVGGSYMGAKGSGLFYIMLAGTSSIFTNGGSRLLFDPPTT